MKGHEIRLPPKTVIEADEAIAYLTLSIDKIKRDLAERTAEGWTRETPFAEWRRKTLAALDVHTEQRQLFRYYREMLRVPSAPGDPPWSRHLDTRQMRTPITLEEAEAAVEALTAAIGCCDAAIADIQARGDTSEGAVAAVDRATVARRHYTEAMPAMIHARARLRADAYGPLQHLDAFVRSLAETLREQPAVRLAVSCLRSVVEPRATEARQAA